MALRNTITFAPGSSSLESSGWRYRDKACGGQSPATGGLGPFVLETRPCRSWKKTSNPAGRLTPTLAGYLNLLSVHIPNRCRRGRDPDTSARRPALCRAVEVRSRLRGRPCRWQSWGSDRSVSPFRLHPLPCCQDARLRHATWDSPRASDREPQVSALWKGDRSCRTCTTPDALCNTRSQDLPGWEAPNRNSAPPRERSASCCVRR